MRALSLVTCLLLACTQPKKEEAAGPLPIVASAPSAVPLTNASASEPPAVSAAPIDPDAPRGSRLTNAPTTSSEAVGDADQVITALRPRFRECYETAKTSDPTIAGMVTCGVRIGKNGKVAAVS